MDLHVNSILQANPFDRPWRKHMARRLHAKTRQSASVLLEPSLECPSAHSCGICKFVFVCAFHGLLICLQRYNFFGKYARKITTNLNEIAHKSDTFRQRMTTLFLAVVTLHRERTKDIASGNAKRRQRNWPIQQAKFANAGSGVLGIFTERKKSLILSKLQTN